MPTGDLTLSVLTERMIHRRAVEAFLWGIPAVNFELLYQSMVRAKGAWNQVVYWSRLVLAWGLGFYFHHFGAAKFARFFGFLAAPAVFMTWLYCSAIAVLLGAEINLRLRTGSD